LETKDNLVKKTCKELGINQKQLAEITKFKEQTIRNWSSKGAIPDYGKAFLDMLLKFSRQKETINHFKNFNKSLQNIDN